MKSNIWSVSDQLVQHATYMNSVVGPFTGVEHQEASFNDGLLADFGDSS